MLKGIFFSIFASSAFGFLYFYTSFLSIFNGHQAFAWRIIALFPFLTLLLILVNQTSLILNIFHRIFRQPLFFLFLLISALLCGVQLWLFMWGPMNGRGLQVSLGYFLLPIILSLVGRVFFKEPISKIQLIALCLSIIGVAHEIITIGSISWECLTVAFGYSLYFVIRKKLKTDHLGGFWWDIFLLLPVSFLIISIYHFNFRQFLEQPTLIFLVINLGLISSLALGSYMLASKYLPMILFGLLSYIEPILLLIVSLLIGEKLNITQLLTYIPIWIAVFLLCIEGLLFLCKNKTPNINN